MKIFSFCIPIAKGKPPLIKENIADQKLLEGKDLTLHVSFESEAECQVEWSKDAETIEAKENIILRSSDKGSKLTLKSVREEDSGRYSCELKNEYGTTSTSCVVEVEEIKKSPEFVSKLQAIHVGEGKNAEFKVQVKGVPEPTLEWFKDDKPIKDTPRYLLSETEHSSHKLVIENCKVSDKGRIKCIAKNKAGEKSCWADLLIQQKIGPPRIEVIGDLLREIEDGNNIVLEVEVTGKPKAKVEWSKNGKPMMWNTRKCEVKSNGDRFTLTILRATDRDAGDYKILATSSAGKESKTFVVKKKGK